MKGKSLFFFALGMLASVWCVAQTPSADMQKFYGYWKGRLEVGIQKLDLFLVIGYDSTDKPNGYFISPSQGAMNIPVSKIIPAADSLKLLLPDIRAKFEALLIDDTMNGLWTQGKKYPLKLFRVNEIPLLNRPQEPKRPFPYIEEEVVFENREGGVNLSGTLTIPKGVGPFPALVLISGSGPQNRDEEIMGHKPFLYLSDFLTRRGIMVLRYDDRGTGKSGGLFAYATTHDLAGDAAAAYKFLASRSEADSRMTGLAGHSEGGIIAPIIAAADTSVDFIIMLAGTGVRGDKLLELQTALIMAGQLSSAETMNLYLKTNRKIYNIVTKIRDDRKAAAAIADAVTKAAGKMDPADAALLGYTSESMAAHASVYLSPWFRTFLQLDPADYLKKVRCPVLALNGSLDLQVPAGVNLAAIEKALKKGKNSQYTMVEFPGLNHLFQTAVTGHPDEYSEISETMSPEVAEKIYQWILQLKK